MRSIQIINWLLFCTVSPRKEVRPEITWCYLLFLLFIYYLFIFNELSYGPSKVYHIRVLILNVELDPFLLKSVVLQDSLTTVVEICAAGIVPIQVLLAFALWHWLVYLYCACKQKCILVKHFRHCLNHLLPQRTTELELGKNYFLHRWGHRSGIKTNGKSLL